MAPASKGALLNIHYYYYYYYYQIMSSSRRLNAILGLQIMAIHICEMLIQICNFCFVILPTVPKACTQTRIRINNNIQTIDLHCDIFIVQVRKQ